MTLEELKAKKTSLVDKMQALLDAAEDAILTDEQQAEFDQLKAEHDTTLKAIENQETLEAAKAYADRPVPAVKRIVNPQAVDTANHQHVADVEGSADNKPKITVPAFARSCNLNVFESHESAYGFGMYLKACLGNARALQWCNDHGLTPMATQNETTDADGGYLVPMEYSLEIIKQLNTYGIARRYCQNVPMTRLIKGRNKRSGGLSVSFVGESAPGGKSKMTWDRFNLTAKKARAMAVITKELGDDALVSVADEVGVEMVYQFGAFEDDVLFNADGSATYKTITGLYKALETADDNVLSEKHSLEEISLAECNNVIAKTPSFARIGAAWYVSPLVNDSVFNRLKQAAGGNSGSDIENGHEPKFLGYPVRMSDACNVNGDADGAIVAIFGNLARSTDFGDRKEIEFTFSEDAVIDGQSMFENDEIAVKAIERFDIKNHSPECLHGLILDTVA